MGVEKRKATAMIVTVVSFREAKHVKVGADRDGKQAHGASTESLTSESATSTCWRHSKWHSSHNAGHKVL